VFACGEGEAANGYGPCDQCCDGVSACECGENEHHAHLYHHGLQGNANGSFPGDESAVTDLSPHPSLTIRPRTKRKTTPRCPSNQIHPQRRARRPQRTLHLGTTSGVSQTRSKTINLARLADLPLRHVLSKDDGTAFLAATGVLRSIQQDECV